MSLWSKLSRDLDRAGQRAAEALADGKLRFEILRLRHQADAAAQSLGYATYRARTASAELDPGNWQRLATIITEREAEIARLESQIKARHAPSGQEPPDDPPAPGAPASAPDAVPPPARHQPPDEAGAQANASR